MDNDGKHISIVIEVGSSSVSFREIITQKKSVV